VSTLAGNGHNQATDGTGAAASFGRPLGLAIDGSGNLFVADQGSESIRKVTPSGIVTTIYRSTDIDPYQLVLDKTGNIYVADVSANKIKKVTQNGVSTTFAGSGEIIGGALDGTGSGASFLHPSGLTIDGSGNLLVLDSGNGLIRQITPAAVVTTFGGRNGSNLYGPITTASFSGVEGITVDGSGNIYLTVQNEIRKISMQ
jgi:sugar lactone lactonase YvrE